MKEAFRVSLSMLATMTVLTGVFYPLAITALAQVAFPYRANGSLVVPEGRAVGSSLVGQPFRDPGHFWGRPSATTPTPCNAASSGGSNLGPLNPGLRSEVEARIGSLRGADPSIGKVPVDLVTASGSGLDPHISPAAAEVQVARVAKARGKPEDEIRRLVAIQAEGRQFGLLGEPRVNVLLLNLALDYPRFSADVPWRVTVPTHHVMPSEGPHELRTHMDLDAILHRSRRPGGGR